MRKARFRKRSDKKACAKSSFVHVFSEKTVQYASEKVILIFCDLFTLASVGRKHPNENNSRLCTTGVKVKNVSDKHIIVARAEGKGDKYVIWGIVYLLPWCIY